MSKVKSDGLAVGRRDFLKVIGVAGVSTTLPAATAVAAATAAPTGHGHVAAATNAARVKACCSSTWTRLRSLTRPLIL